MPDLLHGGVGQLEPADRALRVPRKHEVRAQGVPVQVDTDEDEPAVRDMPRQVRPPARHLTCPVVPPGVQGGLEANESDKFENYKNVNCNY